MSDRPPYSIPEKGVEEGARGKGKPDTEVKIGDRGTENDVDRPGVESPMQKREAHGLLKRIQSAGFSDGRVVVMHDGLCDPIEDQSHAHSSGEEHGEPSEFPEFRSLVILPQPYPSVRAYVKPDHKDQEDENDQDVIPTKVLGDEIVGVLEDHSSGIGPYPPEKDDR